MIKRYLRIIIPVLLVIAIIIGVWWITDPNRNQQVQLPQKEIISKLEISSINLNEYGIYNMIPIDEENYILITRQFGLNEELIPIEDSYINNYYIYKYNTKTGLEQTNININSFFQIAGINKNKKVLYLATTNLEIPEGEIESPYNIVELNYETMQIQDTITDKNNYYSCIISDNGDVWTYLVDNSLYSSGYNFENEKLIVGVNPEELDRTYIYPCDIINNNIVYIMYNSEDVNNGGICIANSDGTNIRLIQEEVPIYIAHNATTNEIYYTTSETMNQLFAVNIDTLAKRVLFEYSLDDKAITVEYYISPDEKNIVLVEKKYVDNIQTTNMYLYEIGSNKLVAQYELGDNNSVSYINFMKDKITFIQSNKLYEWNYTIK